MQNIEQHQQITSAFVALALELLFSTAFPDHTHRDRGIKASYARIHTYAMHLPAAWASEDDYISSKVFES